ncbi:hypothetical protein [Streptomyces sp. NPDC057496]|uniref:hypothetical protein n=1 Tax=Streptomyces sp. NPDC057496 TaxID=3346149 RepID=UPI00368463EB
MSEHPAFQIVTIDGTSYTEGQTEDVVFADLGGHAPYLKSYVHDGDYLELRYSDGFTQLLPEHRVKYIASRQG